MGAYKLPCLKVERLIRWDHALVITVEYSLYTYFYRFLSEDKTSLKEKKVSLWLSTYRLITHSTKTSNLGLMKWKNSFAASFIILFLCKRDYLKRMTRYHKIGFIMRKFLDFEIHCSGIHILSVAWSERVRVGKRQESEILNPFSKNNFRTSKKLKTRLKFIDLRHVNNWAYWRPK